MCALCLPEQLVGVEMGETGEGTGVLGGKNQCFGLRLGSEVSERNWRRDMKNSDWYRVLSVNNREGGTPSKLLSG